MTSVPGFLFHPRNLKSLLVFKMAVGTELQVRHLFDRYPWESSHSSSAWARGLGMGSEQSKGIHAHTEKTASE